ncbi:MAG: immunoglobulin domain-containing protein [Candidatus Sumerlaeia bacterium]
MGSRQWARMVSDFVVALVFALTAVNANAEYAAETGTGYFPFWGFASFDEQIGYSNIVIFDNAGQKEIIIGGAPNSDGYATNKDRYWQVLTVDPQFGAYFRNVHMSPYYGSSKIAKILVGDVVGDGAKEIVVVSDLGSKARVDFYTVATKTWISGFDASQIYIPGGVALGDLDADGKDEIVMTDTITPYEVAAYDGNGAFMCSIAISSSYNVVVGQMDDDASLEIGLSSGQIFDFNTRALQWNTGYNYPSWDVRAVDVDADGRDEFIGWAKAFDVETQSQKWDIASLLAYSGKFDIVNVDADPGYELVAGGEQWGNKAVIIDLDTWTTQFAGVWANHGCSGITAGDIDGDGVAEIIWGDGNTSTGEDELHVIDAVSHAYEFDGIQYDVPFIGPEVGDLDGDGHDELVICSFESDSGYDSGRIVVFDAETLRRLGTSSGVFGGSCWEGVTDIDLVDVNHDGDMEIVIGAERLYDGGIEVQDFNPATGQFSVLWSFYDSNADRFVNIAPADIDNDGTMDFAALTGSTLAFYRYGTGAKLWSYNAGSSLWKVEIANLDNDPQPEVVLLANNGLHIVDSTSRTLQQLISGTFGGIAIKDGGIVAGNQANMVAYRFNGSTIALLQSTTVLPGGNVIGVTPTSLVPLKGWFSSGGVLRYNKNGSITVTTPNYGYDFGNQVVYLSALDAWAAANTYGLIVFKADNEGNPPSVVQHPSSVWAPLGTEARFSVVGTGARPISYQWRKDGIDVPGATSSTLIMNPVSAANAGWYTCRLTNYLGQAISNGARLTVVLPPTITGHPGSSQLPINSNALFSISVSGTDPFQYQWFKDGAPISGAIGSTYTIYYLREDDEGDYTCRVSNAAGSVTSNIATLTVLGLDISWVSFSDSGAEVGTEAQPFHTIGKALSYTNAGGTVKIKPGSNVQPLRIEKAIRLEAPNGPVRLGGS